MPFESESRAQNAAKMATKRAIASGKIKRPDHCQKCGRKGRTEAAHDTYLGKNRTKVRFLCPSCHRKEDMGVRKPGAPPVKRSRGKESQGASWSGSGAKAAISAHDLHNRKRGPHVED